MAIINPTGTVADSPDPTDSLSSSSAFSVPEWPLAADGAPGCETLRPENLAEQLHSDGSDRDGQGPVTVDAAADQAVSEAVDKAVSEASHPQHADDHRLPQPPEVDDVAAGEPTNQAHDAAALPAATLPAAALPSGDAPAATPDGTSPAARISAIYERLLANCQVPQITGDLRFAAPLTDVRRGHDDPNALVQQMRTEFDDALLCEAGVLQLDAHGNAHLHADLVGEESLWLALRDRAGNVYELIGRSGCVRISAPAFLAAAFDASFRAALSRSGNVLIVGDIADMVLLRSLGLAAVTSAGLVDNCEQPHSGFDQLLEGNLPALPDDDPTLERWICNVCLVAGSIADRKLAEPAEFARLVAQMRRLHAAGILKTDTCIWRPTTEEVVKLILLGQREKKELMDQALDVIVQGTPELSEPAKLPPPPEPKLAQLYFRAIEASPVWKGLDDAERKVCKTIFQKFTAPFIEQAEALCQVDPVQANLLLDLAHQGYAVHCRSIRSLNVAVDQRAEDKAQWDQHRRERQDWLQLLQAAQSEPTSRGPSRGSVRTINVPPSYVRLGQS